MKRVYPYSERQKDWWTLYRNLHTDKITIKRKWHDGETAFSRLIISEEYYKYKF